MEPARSFPKRPICSFDVDNGLALMPWWKDESHEDTLTAVAIEVFLECCINSFANMNQFI